MTALVRPGTVIDNTADPRWVPVRVEARFVQPIVGLPKDPMHLDGPLSWAAYLDAVDNADRETLRLPPMREWAHDFRLPLATWTAPCTRDDPDPRLLTAGGTVWGWACSSATYQIMRHDVAHVRRRPAVDQMARWTASDKYHPALGPRRAANMQHQAVWVDAVSWWALAEPARLAALLARLTNVGRLARHGWGRILDITVTTDDTAVVQWRRRNFPQAGGAPATVRAPYHHDSRRMPCTSLPPADDAFEPNRYVDLSGTTR